MYAVRTLAVPSARLVVFIVCFSALLIVDSSILTTMAHSACALPPTDVSDADCDGLVDDIDPCPADTLNRCNGPIATCVSAPPGAPPGSQECFAGSPLRLDLGATAPVTDCNGDAWEAESSGNGSNCCTYPTLTSDPIVGVFGCTDPSTEAMVGSEKFGPTITRSYPIADGLYIVNLLFAETFAGSCQVGRRTMDIFVEGQQFYGGPAAGDGFDQYKSSLVLNGAVDACGGLVVRSLVVPVTDGVLNVSLVEDDPTVGDGNAALKAIEVMEFVGGCISDADCDDGDVCTDDVCNAAHVCENPPGGIDLDQDNICDLFDACPDDGLNDVDGDGYCAGHGFAAPALGDQDDCPFAANADQADADGDGRGDACDLCRNAAGTAEDACLGLGAWEPRAANAVARGEAGTAYVGGKIYLMGGEQADAGRSVEIYDVASDTWTAGPDLPGTGTTGTLGRSHLQPVVIGSKIYVFGGLTTTSRDPIADVIVLDSDDVAAGWRALAPMPTPRGSVACASRGVNVFCVGGVPPSAEPSPPSTDILEMYNTVDDRWVGLSPAPHARDSAYAHVIGDKLYVVSGRDTFVNAGVPFTDVYDIPTDTWSTAAAPPLARGGYASEVLEGRVLLVSGELGAANGGNADGVLSRVDEYDPARDLWRSLSEIPTPRHGFMAVVAPSGPGMHPAVHTISGGPHQGFAGSTVHEVFSFSECASDADCDDGNPCSDDTCSDGFCSHDANLASCDDGIFCNGADTCSDGACQVHAGTPCDDGVGCTVDSCDEVGDECANQPDDSVCDDGGYCNGAEFCDSLLDCQGGLPVGCDDGVACTVDVCDEAGTTCTHAADDSICDDGTFCNGAETCDVAGGCLSGAPPVCDDGISCTSDSCDEAADACASEPVDLACDDGNPCTDDVCDAALGCSVTDNQAPCDDGIACTSNDTCGAGHCAGTANCAAGFECFADADQCLRTEVCIGAATDPTAVFEQAMTADEELARGDAVGPLIDLDPDLDSIMPSLVYAASNLNSGSGGSGDQVSYTFEIPFEDTWYLWARMYYPGAPGSNDANSFFVQVDGGTLQILGNNKDYFQRWHWDGDGTIQSGTPGTALALGTLAAGPHSLVVAKREVNPTAPRLDVLCMTRRTSGPPSDASVRSALGACTSEVDCNDDNVCTDDLCTGGMCQFVANAAACDDGVYCNGQDVCDAGACTAHPTAACDDGVACTIDACDEASRSCSSAADDALCDDGLACSGVETCDRVAGCTAGTAIDCDDSIACTTDACQEPSGTCAHVTDDAVCNDGLACNGVEACDAALGCTSGAAVDCNDGVDCTTDACDDATGACSHDGQDAACNDGIFCNGVERCDLATGCAAGPAVTCDDGIGCTVDACDVTTDACRHDGDDAACNDDVYCNGTEHCDPATGCAAGPAVACDDGIGCTIDSCDETSESCSNQTDDSLCDDGLFCDGAETCSATFGCQPGIVPVCSDPGESCSVLVCNEATDRCQSAAANEAGVCDDGDMCTLNDRCENGVCVSDQRNPLAMAKVRAIRKGGPANDYLAIVARFDADSMRATPDVAGMEIVLTDEHGEPVYGGILPAEAFQMTSGVYRYRGLAGEYPEANGMRSVTVKPQTSKNRVKVQVRAIDCDVSLPVSPNAVGLALYFGDLQSGSCISEPTMACRGDSRVRCQMP